MNNGQKCDDEKVREILDAFKPFASLADVFDDYEPSPGREKVMFCTNITNLRIARAVYRKHRPDRGTR